VGAITKDKNEQVLTGVVEQTAMQDAGGAGDVVVPWTEEELRGLAVRSVRLIQ